MSRRRNGYTLPPSTEPLLPSDQDCIQLALSIEERFLTLCQAYVKARGIQLQIPDDIYPAALRWREMLMRHRKGDFRHTPSELKSIRTMAQWTLDVNCEIRNQPKTKIVWKD